MSGCLQSFSLFQGKRVHLGVCGSIAAYKAVEIMRCLQKLGLHVSVTLTDSGARFLSPLTFAALGADPVYTTMFGQDDGVLFGHLQPGRTADVLLIAPATATTLARLASGLADDMLAAQALAFPGPIVLAPAMNPHMWRNPATQQNVAVLTKRGSIFVQPDSGAVACGDIGQGKLAALQEILLATVKALAPQDLAGQTVLVTLGPTREQWDGVRVWTNLSTGRMGAALVYAAYMRGATVHAIAGPGVPDLPAGVCRHDVQSAREMLSAAQHIWPDADLGLFTAAVADFSPVPYGKDKFKKADAGEGFTLHFVPNPDILATLAQSAKKNQRILGFAAETARLEEAARAKLRLKKAHLIVGNLLGGPDAGFASRTNTVFVCDKNGREEHWPTLTKEDVAWRLLDWLLSL